MSGILNIFISDLAFTFAPNLFSFIITYFIFRKQNRKPNGKLSWIIVFAVPWVICGVWATLISGQVFGKLWDGMGFLFIPFGFSIIMAVIIGKSKEN